MADRLTIIKGREPRAESRGSVRPLRIATAKRAIYGEFRGTAKILSFVFCLWSSALCYAEDFPDPTRPPAIIAAPVIMESGAADNQLAELRSIIISKTRRAAIIGSETVELGGKYGDATLVDVNEGSVVLKNAQGRQVLTLFPDVKMNAVNVDKMIDKKAVKAKPQPAASKVQAGKQQNKPVAR